MTGFPEGRRFAFTIFDDTDHATVANVAPVYDLLRECGMRTTKSVWVYPPRGRYTGQTLADGDYRDFVLGLQGAGFEIALHGVGDGAFTRQEIARGLDTFRDVAGHDPAVHANHSGSPHNIYWWDERFEWPLRPLYRRLRSRPAAEAGPSGSDPESPCFWGDLCKDRIRYVRNLTFGDIDTLACDPRMPYRVRRKEAYSNYWFSGSDGHTAKEFTDLITPENCGRLERNGGVCIVYTHFARGFVDRDGRVEPRFAERLRALAARGGWFVPVSTLLDHLLAQGHGGEDPGYLYRASRDILWLRQRLAKRLRYGY